MKTQHHIGSDVTVLNDHLEVPGIGLLDVNSFVLQASEPVVIDTGLGLPDRDFVADVGSVIDPGDVRWIWLTHPDRDHTGGIFQLLDAAPQARVVTTYLGLGVMSTERPLPLDRVFLLNSGQSLDVGDRTLTGLRPPLFDNPATVGVYDDRSKIYFASDCFGAPVPTTELAGVGEIGDLPKEILHQGQLVWATVDSPWVHLVDENRFYETFQPLRAADPYAILSTHLPPAVERTDELLDTIAEAPRAEPFVGFDQAALEEMLASFQPEQVPSTTPL
jgi:hypothetical protein